MKSGDTSRALPKPFFSKKLIDVFLVCGYHVSVCGLKAGIKYRFQVFVPKRQIFSSLKVMRFSAAL
ncbi:MAG: hypothetical protein H7A51_06680 [Akkermansiaceae bacterium]|nr:hypothetical protein [Akkermansiaceae bacterium]